MQDKLGLAHLVGTPMLKPYMHGFFVDARLHGKAKAAAAPFAYEEYRAQRVAQKLEEERKSRISLVKKAPKVGKTVGKMVLPGHRASRLARGLARCLRACSHGVGSTRPRALPFPSRTHPDDGALRHAIGTQVNAAMAARLLDAEAGAGAKKATSDGTSLLADDRFAAMFRDEEFAIDEASKEYLALHPNAGKSFGDGREAGLGRGRRNHAPVPAAKHAWPLADTRAPGPKCGLELACFPDPHTLVPPCHRSCKVSATCFGAL